MLTEDPADRAASDRREASVGDLLIWPIDNGTTDQVAGQPPRLAGAW